MNHNVKISKQCSIPALGLGTWYIGDSPAKKITEIASIRLGIEMGAKLIDTAEMYGNGLSESLVGEAISPYSREDLYLVSKVLPQNACRKRLEQSLDASLKRLGTDYLDLYLYHWRGSHPLDETVACLEDMKKKGKIKDWGVSNFDIDDMEDLWNTENGNRCIVNQVLYHLGSRGIEFSLLPWMETHQVTLMSYCPLAQGAALCKNLFSHPVITRIAEKYRATPSQIILSWNIRNKKTIAIPKSATKEHTFLNMEADKIELASEDLSLIDSAFPPPTRKEWLDIQ